MRVALVAPEIPDYSVEFSHIVAKRCEVLLLVPEKHSIAVQNTPQLEIARLSWPRQRSLQNISFLRALSRQIRSWKPDVVHFLNESNIWLTLLIPMLGGIPALTTVHDIRIHPGDSSSSRVPRFLTKILIRQSNAIIVHGEILRSEAIRELPVSADKVFVVPHPPLKNYLGIARQENFRKPRDGKFRVLFFGRIYRYKGLRYLLDAAISAHRVVPNIEVLIAGSGDDMSYELQQLGRPPFLKIDNRFVPASDVARFFSEADLVVLPYIEASQSGVLMLAMAFGLPVVATEVGEIPTVVRSVGMGLVVPPSNGPALASAITRLALDPDMLQQFSKGATNAVNGEYSDGALCNRIISTYENVVSRVKTH
jgi:glycosyltransferase involved in cell wall biosynthesis